MDKRKSENLLDEPQDLYGDAYERASKRRKSRFGRWYRIYLFTTVLVVCLTVTLLISVLFYENIPLLRGFGFENIASSIIRGSFIDFSTLFRTDDTTQSTPPQNTPPQSLPQASAPPQASTPQGTLPPTPTPDTLYDFDYSKVPEGHTPIIPQDLSLISYGSSYLFNSTGYKPDTQKLIERVLSWEGNAEYLSSKSRPQVLIVHTHGTESYSEEGAISFLDDGSEIARSEDISKNVVAVGARLAQRLEEAGISTLHCTVMHDKLQYKDSYLRAQETIKQYLKKYPSIKLVIDVHRDSIMKSTGELVRPVTLVDSRPAAQVMCVVGSDWGGEPYENWEGNLSLALKLRKALNQKHQNLCRPTYLRPTTYNQELSPYSLLLEVGSSGNSLSEALYSADLVADALVELLKF